MDENELNDFCWSGLFLVTSICSFGFMGLVKLLNNNYPTFFLLTGTIFFVLWVFNRIAQMAIMFSDKRKKEQAI